MKAKRTHRPWRDSLMESIQDPKEAAAYLSAAAEQGDGKAFLIALKDVVSVHGGISVLARQTKLSRGNLHRIFAGQGYPRLDSLKRILAATGFSLKIEPTPPRQRKTSRAS